LYKSLTLLSLSLSILFGIAWDLDRKGLTMEQTSIIQTPRPQAIYAQDNFSVSHQRSSRRLAAKIEPAAIDPVTIAQEITVRIEGASNGSGAIIERNGDTYYVLTNAHVFKKAGSYMVIAPDGNRYPVDDSKVMKLPGMDLAVFSFVSPLAYEIATIGNDDRLTTGEKVYVSGWPRAGTLMRQRIFVSTQGKVTETESKLSRGYSLTYTNLVRVGMSGGPILNQKGELIGIHGLARLQDNSDRVVSSGIKINKFLQWHAFNTLPEPTLPETQEQTVAGNSSLPKEENTTFSPSIEIDSPIDFTIVKTLSVKPGSLTSVAMSDRVLVSECTEETCEEPFHPLVSSSSDGTISVWNLTDGQLLKTWRAHRSAIDKVAISPNGEILATASDDRSIGLWSLKTGKLLHSLKAHRNAVTSLIFSPDGQKLVSGSWDKTVRIWQVNGGKLVKTLVGHPHLVNSLAISSNGRVLASGSPDGSIRLWNLKTGKITHNFKTNATSVLSLVISSNGQQLASGGGDGTIEVWNLSTGKKTNVLTGHTDGVWSLAIAKDNHTLVSGSWDKTIKLWNLETGKLQRTLNGHSDYVMSVALSSDALTLISGAWNSQIDIWRRVEAKN
jgi:WD40 repeat protein